MEDKTLKFKDYIFISSCVEINKHKNHDLNII